MPRNKAQELVRALFPNIESSGSAKTLAGRMFQRKTINFACLQKIRQAQCDEEANTLLAEHLYQSGTEKTLQDFANILKESDLPRQQALGERIEAALSETHSPRSVFSDERLPGSPRGPRAEGSSEQELQQPGVQLVTLIVILTITLQ